MTCAADLRTLRDALDMVAHGGLPTWFEPSSTTGREAMERAQDLVAKYHEALAAAWTADARVRVADARADAEHANNELLTALLEEKAAQLAEALRR